MVTGALGGTWAYVWQRSSAESLRINRLYHAAQQIRGDLFRQIKDVYLARLLEESTALRTYTDYSRRIDDHFNDLRRNTRSRDEAEAVQAMQQAYRVMQQDMNKAFADPYLIDRVARVRILEPAQEKNFVAAYEEVHRRFEALVTGRSRELEVELARWTRIAPVAIPLPILLAIVLLAVSRRSVQRGFVAPMAGLVAGASRLSSGGPGARLAEDGVAEVAELARTMNTMAAELAASQEALVDKEKQAALGSLVPVVAHNIRNPLAAIRASAQLIDASATGEDLAESRRDIIETVDRLGRWVTALVSYLHPLKPHPVRVRPEAIAEAALRLLAPRLADKTVRVERAYAADAGEVMADADLMEQAVYGLLSNAVDASPDGATLRVEIAAAGNAVTLAIVDAGPGMPFQPDPRELSPGPSTKRFGTGLGIPVAYKVCRAHGWQLEFLPGPDGGTRVVISAPVAP